MDFLKKQWQQAYRLRRIGLSICDATNHIKVRDALRIATGHINGGERHYKHSMMPDPAQTPIAQDVEPVLGYYHPSKQCEPWCHSRQPGFTDKDCNCWN